MIALTKEELVLDLFAGGGGASLGVAWAIGRSPDIAVNHDLDAITMHERNHPDTLHLHSDIREVDIEKHVAGRPVGWMHASPDCFVAGTLILTKRGLIPIENVRVGDEVVTHRNNWKKVTKTLRKRAPICVVKGPGSELQTTYNHPIWSPSVKESSAGDKIVREDKWIEPEQLVKQKRRWATPTEFPRMDMPQCPFYFSEDLWQFLGLYARHGTISHRSVRIILNEEDAERLSFDMHSREGPDLNLYCNSKPVKVTVDRQTSGQVYVCVHNSEFATWVGQSFGVNSSKRKIPPWLLSAQRNWRRPFLRGFFKGWAWDFGEKTRALHTVSKELAVGLKLLLQTERKRVFLVFKKGCEALEDKPARASAWRVGWRHADEESGEEIIRRHLLTPVQSAELAKEDDIVHCIEVEGDESYVADGVVVHNCTFHSRARGAKPIRREDQKVRALPWVICDWAQSVKPRMITLENVPEFVNWTCTLPQWKCKRCRWSGVRKRMKVLRGRTSCPKCKSVRVFQTEFEIPDPDKIAMTFKRWCKRLRNLGYELEYKVLNAADYGAPTARKRLFLVARRDGESIRWPEQTYFPKKHATGSRKRWKPIHPCIDWTIPCPSIFTRKKPLKPKTMRRVAMGLKKYVIDAEKPFLVRCSYGSEHFRGQPTDEPHCTQPQTNVSAVVQPYVVPVTHGGDRRCHDGEEPFPTITGANRGEHMICGPQVESVAAFMARHFGGMVGRDLEEPGPTTTVKGSQNQIVAASLIRNFGNSVGQSMEDPAPTATQGNKSALAAAALIQTGYGERKGQKPRVLDLEAPSGTIVAGGVKQAAVAANLVHFNHGDKQWSGMEDPSRTVTTNNHAALVYSWLVKYFGTAVGQPMDKPLGAVTTKGRYGVVMVEIMGENFVIVDIGLRMLTPRELARAQGFPDTYVLTGNKTSQTAKIGNSVPPHVIAALGRVNLESE